MTVTESADTLDRVYADYDADPAFDLLRRDARQIVRGEGPLDPYVIFIGEAPGRNEDEAGRPFVGKAGDYFNKLLESIRLRREDVFVTNVVKYRPKENRDPTYGEIMQSKAYLDRELAILNCRIIVPLGRHALSVFVPDQQLKEVHGRSIEREGRFIVPQYHPAIGGIYNKEKFGPIMMADFKQIELVLDATEA